MISSKLRPFSNNKQQKSTEEDNIHGEQTNWNQIFPSIGVVCLIILMCIFLSFLKIRMKRRAVRAHLQEAINAREHEKRILKFRKEEARNMTISLVLRDDSSVSSMLDDHKAKQCDHTSGTARMRSYPPFSDIISNDCSICFQAFNVGDTLSFSTNIDCSHFFHQMCIINWLARSSNCPTCRRDYLSGVEENNTATESENINVRDIEEHLRPPSHFSQIVHSARSELPEESIVHETNGATV